MDFAMEEHDKNIFFCKKYMVSLHERKILVLYKNSSDLCMRKISFLPKKKAFIDCC